MAQKGISTSYDTQKNWLPLVMALSAAGLAAKLREGNTNETVIILFLTDIG